MGLAAYGSPSFADLIYKQILSVDERGLFQLQSPLLFWFDMESDYALAKLEALLQHPARRKDEKLTQFHADVAASIQAVTEEVLVRLARYATAVTGRTKLCLAGGVIQNCVANGRIIAAGVCEELWIQPLANDSGTAVGAALWHYHGIEAGHAAGRWKMTTAQLGIGYADEDVASLLERVDLPYGESEHVASHAAEWLGQGHIVGWFQGRAEVGPRALGGRSLLADPARPFSAYRMNAVKGRQGWRPLAPSLLAERAASYFVGAVPSPYMIVSLPLRPEVRASLPAVSHVDGSARLQTVSPEPASPYRLLIEAFERRSGVPVVLNTSFNLRGEPIVQHPLDAIRTFLLTGVERLVIGRFLVEEKPDLPSGLRRALHASLYPSLYLHYLGSARRVAILAHPALTPAQRLRGEHLRILLQWLKIPCDSLSPAALPSWLETSPADGATLLSVAPHLDHTLLSGLHQRRNVALSVLVVDQRMFAVRQGVEAFLTTVERNYQRLRELVLHQELLVVCSTASEVSEIASIAAHLSLRVAGYYCWRDEQGLEDRKSVV